MEESSRYAVGLDVGTENVRAVVLAVNNKGETSVVGYGEATNKGMRKGVVANLAGPAEAIDKMLSEVERMSGYEINSAYVSINGSHVMSTKTSGMIAVGAENSEISEDDLYRVEDSATTGRIPANRDVLAVLPQEYTLDGQSGIRDPIGMTGTRLEIEATVISALAPNCTNLRKATEYAEIRTERLIPSVMAAARAVLTERQMENGVAVVDLGAATTSVAVFEGGDLQFVGVVPIGSNNITNDLAIMLEIEPAAAEDIKRRYITGAFNESDKDIVVKKGREEMRFSREEVNEIVKARMSEIFDSVRKELKMAHYDRRLPEGVVLVGGGAKMRDIELFAKQELEAAVRIGVPGSGLTVVSDTVEKPEFAAAMGLALMALEDSINGKVEQRTSGKLAKKKAGESGSPGFIKKLFKKF